MLTVIIPAFNEERTLAEVLDRVLALSPRPQVIAVDDGSTDGTASIIHAYERSHKIIGVICARNGGKGAAIQAGLAHATQPYTLIQDADLEYFPEDYETLLAPIRDRKARVVFGSRNLRHPAMRQNHFQYFRFWLGGKVVTLAANFLFGMHLTDEATCYKLFPTDVLRKMNLQCRGFDFCPEVTAKARRLGYSIHEVPIRYAPRSMAEGKKIRAWHGIEAILVLLKYRLLPDDRLLSKRKTRLPQPASAAVSPPVAPATAQPTA